MHVHTWAESVLLDGLALLTVVAVTWMFPTPHPFLAVTPIGLLGLSIRLCFETIWCGMFHLQFVWWYFEPYLSAHDQRNYAIACYAGLTSWDLQLLSSTRCDITR